MKIKIKPILTGVLIGVVAFPTITLGGTFVSSLIQGKTIEEAVQILATQIDSLIGRVDILESQQKKEKACRETNEILEEVRYVYAQTRPYVVIDAGKIDDYISATQKMIEEYEELTEIPDVEVILQGLKIKLDKLQGLKAEYLIQKELCE